jgi:HEAT repeat protein
MRAVLVALLVCAGTPALEAYDPLGLRATNKPEPKYKGKPLAYWMERLQQAPTDEEQKVAAHAVIAFGADAAPAVPELLVMLDDRSSEYREQIADVLCRIGPGAKAAVPELVKLLKEKKARDPEHVLRILGAIGPDARDAVPTLTAALDDRELRAFAVAALCKMGPAAKDALPGIRRVVLEIVADYEAGIITIPLSFRRGALCCPVDHLRQLHNLQADAVPILLALLNEPGTCGRDYALSEFEKLGPDGAKGVPALKKFLKHNEPEVRYQACVALWKIEKSIDVVPVLVKLLGTERDDARHYFEPTPKAAELLADIGPAARDALPALRALLEPVEASRPDGTVYFRRRYSTDVCDAVRSAIDKIEQKPKK